LRPLTTPPSQPRAPGDEANAMMMMMMMMMVVVAKNAM